MFRGKKLIAIFLCSLALLIAFSVSTGSAHAASGISHVQAGLSTKLIPLTNEPPGCPVLLDLRDSPIQNFTYEGHSYALLASLYGWYAPLKSGALGFCNQVSCATTIGSGGGYPAGLLVSYCNYGSGQRSTRIPGGNATSIWSNDVATTCGTENWAGASYTPAGGQADTIHSPYLYYVPCRLYP